MGHLTFEKNEEVYNALAQRLFSEIQGNVNEEFVAILHRLYTKSEAMLGSKFPLGEMTVDKIAEAVNLKEDETYELLESMAKKGLVIDYFQDKKHYYFLAPMIIGFFEYTFMRVDENIDLKELAMLFDAYFHSGASSPAPRRMPEASDTKMLRTVFNENIMPLISETKVEDYESIVEIIKKSGGGAISLCACRHSALHKGTKKCDAPLETCVSLGWMGDYIVRRELGRRASVEELLELLDKTEEYGLVHIVDNVINEPVYWCNCCGCCCLVLSSVTHTKNKLFSAVHPSHFAPVIDHEKCISCGTCVNRCQIGAVKMNDNNLSEINTNTCMGCGLCSSACPAKAIEMARVEVEFTIPIDKKDQEQRRKDSIKMLVKDYPHTKKVDFSEDYFGIVVEDPYVWLEKAKDPKVLEWVEKQNKYTDTYFTEIKDANIQAFAMELKENAKVIKYGREYEQGNRIFASKTDENGEFSTVVLDLDYNELETIADSNTFNNEFLIFGGVPSPKNSDIISIMAQAHGAARPSVLIYNYKTKELIRRIDNTFSAVWSEDGERVYYSDNELDKKIQKNINYIKTYNYKTNENKTIFVYDKPVTFIILKKSLGSGYVLAEAFFDYSNNELLEIKDKDITKAVRSLSREELGGFKYIGTTKEKHYIISNLNSPNSKIIAVDKEGGTCENAITIVPESEGILQDATAAEGKIVVSYMKDVVSEVKVFDYKGTFIKNLDLPSDMGTAIGVTVMASAAGNIYFGFESFTDSLTTLRYNLKTDELKKVYSLMKTDVKDNIVVKREFITVRDGTKVPAFIVHRKDIVLDGNNPTVMYGYGGYNIPMPPMFQNLFIGINIHEWVEKGYVYVNCNIRGGNEYGTAWHNGGKLGNKKNVFFDFIDITEWLIENKWTKPEKIAITGGSNGGLLMTALITLRPDLWGAVIASVPHTDMIRFKNDDRGVMYITEYGNPDDKDMFSYMLSYSPYHNIKKEGYPAIYLQTGENDNNVPPYHAKKFAAKMQELHQSENPVLLRVLAEGSHDRGQGDSMYRTFAEMQTFIEKALKA